MINEGQKAHEKLKILQKIYSVYVYITTFDATVLSIPDASNPNLLHSLIWGLGDQNRQEARVEMYLDNQEYYTTLC